MLLLRREPNLHPPTQYVHFDRLHDLYVIISMIPDVQMWIEVNI